MSAIAVDSLGNVYVTGNSDWDYFTIKYDTNGRKLWSKKSNKGDNPSDLAVDSVGNVYVTGNVTIKYDKSMVEKLEE